MYIVFFKWEKEHEKIADWLIVYLQGLRSFTQFFDDCRQSFWVDALLTQPYTYR